MSTRLSGRRRGRLDSDRNAVVLFRTCSVPLKLVETRRRRGLRPKLAHVFVVIGPYDLISICLGISNDEHPSLEEALQAVIPGLHFMKPVIDAPVGAV